MIVRVKLRKGRAIVRNRRKNTKLALAGSALLYPICLMAYVLCVWRLASDMSLVGEFPMRGFWAHWQVSFALGVALNAAAIVLSRYGRGQDLPDFLLQLLHFGKPRPESR
jgi:hypothetical protein